jgi:hypothetical protein
MWKDSDSKILHSNHTIEFRNQFLPKKRENVSELKSHFRGEFEKFSLLGTRSSSSSLGASRSKDSNKLWVVVRNDNATSQSAADKEDA